MEDIEIIIPCMGRLEHLKQSLPQALDQKNVRCIVVDYSCPDCCGDWVEENFPLTRVIRIGGQRVFNLSAARNAGALAGKAPWLCFLDADMLLEPGFMETIRPDLTDDSFFTFSHSGGWDIGSCIVPRAAFESIGGYDGIFQGWGREDRDLIQRLIRKGLKQRLLANELATEIEHDENSRTENYEIKDKQKNRLINRLYGEAKLDLELLNNKPIDIANRQRLYGRCRETAVTALENGISDFRLPFKRTDIAGTEITHLLHYHLDKKPGYQPQGGTRYPDFSAALNTIRERWPELASNSSEEPLFLLATGHRSGSTLVQRMMMDQRWMWGEPYRQAGLIDNLSIALRCLTREWPKDEFLQNHPRYNNAQGHPWIANLYPEPQLLVNATLQYLQTLFADPVRAKGYSLWGIKDVSLDSEAARFLKWLFPRSRFLFLIRNPYFSYRSYQRFQRVWYARWPDQPISSPEQFGAIWLRLAKGYLAVEQELGAMTLRYEDISSPEYDWTDVEHHIGHPVDKKQLQTRVTGHKSDSDTRDPAALHQELYRLSDVVHEFASSIGYWLPTPAELKE